VAENEAQGEWTLPDGWVWATLGEIRVDESYSITPKKTPEQDFELYSVPSFAEGKPEIVKGEQIGSSKRVVQEKAVLLCKINPRINRVWVVGLHSPWPKISSTEWIPFFPVDGIEPGYLCYFMQQDAFRDFLALRASGVGGSLMRVKPTTFADYLFPLPPLPEQRRIVAEIETQFTRLDAAVTALERVQANLRRYKATVLKAACEGRLVPTEAELARVGAHRDAPLPYEPADQLLARILAERRARWEAEHPGKRYNEPAPPDTADLPELPEGWVWIRFDSLLREPLRNGHSAKASKSDDGIRTLTLTAVTVGDFSLA
jgi:type I restriction enzyme S subunit